LELVQRGNGSGFLGGVLQKRGDNTKWGRLVSLNLLEYGHEKKRQEKGDGCENPRS